MLAADNVIAGGAFEDAGGPDGDRIARWNGSAWQPFGSGLNGTVRALAVGADGSLYVGGEFTDAGGIAAADRVVKWGKRL